MKPSEGIARLAEVLDTVRADVQVYDDVAQSSNVNAPALVIAPPTPSWDAAGMGSSPWPTEMSVTVFAVVSAGGVGDLVSLMEDTVAVLESTNNITVNTGDGITPGTFPAGSRELPAYLIELEFGL